MNKGINPDTPTFTAEEMLEEIDTIIDSIAEEDVEGHLWYEGFKDLIKKWDNKKKKT